MAFTRITDTELEGKGVIGQPAVPGLSAQEMQESVEQVVREVAIPGVNRLIEELEEETGAASIGMEPPDGTPEDAPATVQGVVEAHVESKANPHAVTAAQVGAYTKAETDAAINEKVVAIGTADMAQAVYDPQGEGIDATVQTYTHSKTGTVHEFTGSGANGRAKMTADVQAGDSFTLNGEPVTAWMGAEDAADLMAGGGWSGRWVTFVADGEAGTLNFKGGGGKVTVSGLAAGKILSGTTVTVKQGAKTVASVAGSIPGKAAATYTPKTTSQTIAAGQYLSGAQTIQGDANLAAANIQRGRSIFGVAGALNGYCYAASNGGSWISFTTRTGMSGSDAASGTVTGAGVRFGSYGNTGSFSSSIVVPLNCQIVFERSSSRIGAYKNGSPASSGEYYAAGDVFGFWLPSDDAGGHAAFAILIPQ